MTYFHSMNLNTGMDSVNLLKTLWSSKSDLTPVDLTPNSQKKTQLMYQQRFASSSPALTTEEPTKNLE